LQQQGLAKTSLAKTAANAVLPMVRQLGAVQLDTISVLARSHELIAYARLGALPRAAIEAAYWEGECFEYWSHAACILPAETWPLFAFRRRHHVRRGCHWSDAPSPRLLRTVLARLRSDGPLTVSELGGARRSASWWQWSDAKNALEWLLLIGQVTCARRVGWRRVYDLPERALPAEVTAPAGDWVDADGIPGPDDHTCQVALVRAAANTLGIGTAADIADVHRLNASQIPRLAADAGLVPVLVRGWTKPAWATPEIHAQLTSDTSPRGTVRSRTTLLSPFDSLIWFRDRLERLFGITHRLEAYTPAAKREHGYFAMPVLHRGELVARVDPKRKGSTLVADRVTLHDVRASTITGTAQALVEAAGWVQATDIRIGTVRPPTAASPLRRALASQ
jgi:uncharacterized protein YcaQ